MPDRPPEITNPEIELHQPDIPEVIATNQDVRQLNILKRIQQSMFK